ncbi:MAG: hypothetical protein QY331_09105 [Melioribacteraceae bacterium]|nr:MAG: hypothetical protein QY331_09105 [Melioribacteraceae bacterium]
MRTYYQIMLEAEENKANIFLNMPIFKKPKKLATLHRKSRTLELISKSKVNIFRLFGEGLGINEEMILRLSFDFVECRINGTTYKTTREQLLKKGIRSPYQSDKVDRQWILRLEDFHIPHQSEAHSKEHEELLFFDNLEVSYGNL